VSYAQMEAAGIFLVVTRLDLRYKAPARYDDLVVVVTRVTGGGRVRIEHEYEVWRDAEDGRGKSVLLATAASTLACVGAEGAVRELPAWLAPGRTAAGPGG
jgi:acyl-CoA thioester hydrolase